TAEPTTPAPATPAAPAPSVPNPEPAPQTDPTIRRIVTALAIAMVALLAAFLFYALAEHPAAAQPAQAVLALFGILGAVGSILTTLHTLNRRP
ncbi:hypothetical protein ACIQ9Q_33680, partial [Streptomyces sp. NPDC094438]